ncbi:unnamed protein product [Nippostrongylus brasiliensis]|uniref:Alpha-tubulin N-acetyltransferase 1 (inferred by orthology to a C. elegans protein) n=1 Tax=Nippostrongylus brasiliensis TaxID=27835 RepID=A0A0N4YGH4_NIPBR|nr:unnamed protein product [Nippostrongylus brasiliensis]
MNRDCVCAMLKSVAISSTSYFNDLVYCCKRFRKLLDNSLYLDRSHLQILCLLDFYVHYAEQRKGHGKAIIDYMLQTEQAEAYQLALDNPSVTLLGFMSQRYGLSKPVWQNTNFVVFEELFKSVAAVNGAGGLESPPEGWRRPQTPRRIGAGATETRWLEHAISGHSAKVSGDYLFPTISYSYLYLIQWKRDGREVKSLGS